MAHYSSKGKSRLTSRTATTNPEWLKVCSQIGLLVNNWARRGDLAVYGGEDASEGRAVASYYAEIAEIELNIPKAFGTATLPSHVGDLNERDCQYEFPTATGILFHESLHARHTGWDTGYLSTQLDNTEAQAFMLLEESRIEAKGVIERPENKLFLRSSGLNMALEDVNEETLANVSDTWAGANLAGLALARYDARVLEAEDVREIYLAVVALLGEDLYKSLRAVWVEFQTLTVPQVERAIELAKKWVELLREADPEGEPQSGDPFAEESGEGEESEGEGEGKGKGSPSSALAEALGALSESAMNAELNTSDALSDQQTKEEWDKDAKARQEANKDKNNRQQEARKIFDKSHNAEGSGSSSRVQEKRKPTGAERASAVTIAKMLEKAKYRERSVHTRKSVMPVGRLNARVAVQNQAMKSMGLQGDLPAWKVKSRKHTDDPTLKLGVLVDISGSMGSAMESMATTAWVLSEAGRRVQAKTAMVYYGSGVFPTLRVGQRLDEVTVYSAPDGTEKFSEAWTALDGELGMTFGDGVKMLVVVSDGAYTPRQQELCVKALTECRANGVAVLWITPKNCHGYTASAMIRNAGWGVHLDGMETSQIALTVGKSASEALGKVGSLT